jgi:hypothetical protein
MTHGNIDLVTGRPPILRIPEFLPGLGFPFIKFT